MGDISNGWLEAAEAGKLNVCRVFSPSHRREEGGETHWVPRTDWIGCNKTSGEP